LEHKVINAKCPYCKHEFGWIRSLTGEYCPSEIRETCSKCDEMSVIKATNIMKFSSRKLTNKEV